MEESSEQTKTPEINEYKGRPVITLNPGERFPFTFGIAKAKLILKHIDDIRVFVEKYDQ